ncbi:Na()-translocating NADH-quinone reductase subunit F,Na()-translocating NADH-quinone reductase subunit F,Nitric oxide synthase, oxygenase domain,NADH:ubiquinone oxidoreductase, Na()-translocating, F subunit,2Fe-2S iron-sulfur cluster binding domain [Chlamydia poikilotherma]|uniref:Na(+)-translocating NADH-quinone reductase subunit F n=1 Tax=Chlamydia poikilotherma TaxID=1967783 RepID=A0A3B0PQ77_9CHLA|nr:NADH:ubiquinone reductase (Na(+)-transporting) subunit F [Chlamydia poikilotherma]SYX09343.1 Na()-translocating NADH-quinone reductase subunit F,Na()-translocating NADH-quinone reductase subunit F,Nitric oxide synthase, oxygenase domain,NADH:ubiquinone oxidoreductase, Na()-translocating, F subunit,2Fe-2S iron-sulfur cluster binding domain [Chlamydia poikilotherma]
MTWLSGLYFISIASLVFCVIGLILSGIILISRKFLVKIHPCKLKINDDDSLTKTVDSGHTLLSSLLDSGIPIPSPCGGKATCKQCKVKIVKNADQPLETDHATFSKQQLEQGWRLSCQTKVQHDMCLEIEERYLNASSWEGTVVSNDNVATFIKELVVSVSPEHPIPFKPGGYLQISVPAYKTNTSDWKPTMAPEYYSDWEHFNLFDRTIDNSLLELDSANKAYSLASYPAELPLIKFNIRIATPPFINNTPNPEIPWGICSSYIFSLKPGDKINVSGPYGESFMKENNRPLIFLIGGAGSSFGRSHILDLLLDKHSTRDITLWYGARSLKENIYQEEYEKLEKNFSNFHYHLVLSEPLPEDIASGWDKNNPEKTNFLFRAFELGQLSKLSNPEDYLYYVCGPPLHNSSILKLLDNYGVERSSIVLDDFGS